VVNATATDPLARGAFDHEHPPDSRLIDKCVHCGFCLPACPTYALWGEEMDSPRGRIYLMKSALEGRVELNERFVRHFDACLGCMACVTACPSGVQYGPLIEATRAQIERRYPRPAADRLFRDALFRIVPFPNRLRVVLAPLVFYRWLQPLLQRSGLLDLLPRRLRALATLAPPVTLRSLTARVPEHTPARGQRRLKVGLLTGCVQRLVFGRVNEATVRVLAAEGCEVVAPAVQGCCGALPLHAGRLDDARQFARRTIETFERAAVDCVAVNAAGCGSSMKEYGDLLADDPAWAPRARAFSSRVKDVTELLAELGPAVSPRQPLPLRVAYHDACHLAHAQGVREQPRDLLAAIPRLELVAFAEQDMCCGSAGIYNLVQPDAARQLGARKAERIAAVAPDVVATANPGCTLQIAAAAAQQGRTLPVLHPVELIDASMRGLNADDVIRSAISFPSA
jgi:glycolate oxidase iron-sulfur subunit